MPPESASRPRQSGAEPLALPGAMQIAATQQVVDARPGERNNDCPVCQASDSNRLFQKHGYWIRECRCGHRFAEITRNPEHLDRVYGDDYFNAGEAGYSSYLSGSGIVTAQGRFYGELLRKFAVPGSVLDVGAAAGFVLEGLQSTGWTGVGVEPNASMVQHGRSRGLDLRVGGLEDLRIDRQFDLVTMIQVVAHFYDVRRAFEQAAGFTKCGGHWLIETWNKDSATARLFGQGWHEYSPPSVVNWFSPDALVDLASQFGFREVARGRPPKRLQAAHLKSFIAFKLRSSRLGPVADRLLQLIPDGFAIPYPGNDLFWVLLQRMPESRQAG